MANVCAVARVYEQSEGVEQSNVLVVLAGILQHPRQMNASHVKVPL